MQSSPQKSAGFLLRAVLGATIGLAAPICVPLLALAEECPGHPDALGTSRVLVVDPSKIHHVGVMQYPQSLPLADKEVVLTFDDGPLPPHSTAVLDILAAQCVKATFFLVGEMAREFPAVVRRIHEEGHTIGTHTEDHPLRMQKLPVDKVRAEIDRGIADVGGALWDQRDLAPFFRIPGLARSDAIEKELAERSLVVFSSDTVADDWHRRIRSADIVRLALSRLEARGKGILLLHDIHRVTVAALPELLSRLKAAGFHVVHVVPGTSEPAAVASAPAAAEPSPSSASNSSAAAPITPPGVVEAAASNGAAPSEPKDANQPTFAVSDINQPTATSNAPAQEADNAPRPATEAPASSDQIIAANAPAGEPSETTQPMPSPLYDQASVADRVPGHETDGEKQETADGPASKKEVVAAVAPPAEQSEAAPPAPASPNADHIGSAKVSSLQQIEPQSSTSASAAPVEASGTPSHELDDPIWPRPVVGSPADERMELPIPDERAFSIDYRPWRTVKLADGSETAVYLAIDAVPQWTNPPVGVAAGPDDTQLPAPAMPYYFAGDEAANSVAR